MPRTVGIENDGANVFKEKLRARLISQGLRRQVFRRAPIRKRARPARVEYNPNPYLEISTHPKPILFFKNVLSEKNCAST